MGRPNHGNNNFRQLELQAKIRPLLQSDNHAIATIIRRSLEEFGTAKKGTAYFDKSTDHLYEEFRTKRSAYFIVEENSQVIGGAGIYPSNNLPEHTCELVKMYLSKNVRGRGIGRILLSACINEAKALGYKQMYIETMPELATAVSMYHKAGFQTIDNPLGNSGHTACNLWMIKVL